MSGKVGPLSRIYNGIIGAADKYVPASMRPLWEHPAGEQIRLKNQQVFPCGLINFEAFAFLMTS